MNLPRINCASILILLFNMSLNAAQTPEPATAQKEAIDRMHHKLHRQSDLHQSQCKLNIIHMVLNLRPFHNLMILQKLMN